MMFLITGNKELNMAEKKTWFISYAKSDEHWAEWIAHTLEEGGYGAILGSGTEAARANTDALIAVLSRSYLDSEAGKDEWLAAYSRDKTGGDRNILPVRVENVLPEGLLSHRVYIDIFDDAGEEEKKARLLGGLSDEIRELRDIAYQDTGEAGRVFTAHNLSPRNKSFAGREEILTALADTFFQSDTTHPVQILIGKPGAGKTGIALEYAWRNMKKYHTLWVVNAGSAEALDAAYKSLGEAKKLFKDGERDSDTVREAVRNWLENDSGHLLIFDNVEDMNLLEEYLPQEVHGNILMTSRDRGVSAILMLENILVEIDSSREARS
jgi:hypothetical protein